MHYAVMVISESPEEVEEMLAPYNEQDDAYCEFQDETDEVTRRWNEETVDGFFTPEGKMVDKWHEACFRDPTPDEEEKYKFIGTGWSDGLFHTSKDWGDGKGYRSKIGYTPEGYVPTQVPVKYLYPTLEEYAEEYHGYKKNAEGRYGYYSNPQAKWDWYQIGGRYSGRLQTQLTKFSGVYGQKSLLDDDQVQYGYDQAKIGDLDLARMLRDKEDRIRNCYRETIKQDYNENIKRYQLGLDDEEPIPATEDEYVEMTFKGEQGPLVSAYCILTKDGWESQDDHEKGESWNERLKEVLANADPEQWITIVDIHI